MWRCKRKDGILFPKIVLDYCHLFIQVSTIFETRMFFSYSWRFMKYDTLEQLEFKLEIHVETCRKSWKIMLPEKWPHRNGNFEIWSPIFTFEAYFIFYRVPPEIFYDNFYADIFQGVHLIFFWFISMMPPFFQAATLKKIWVEANLRNIRWPTIKILGGFTGYPSNQSSRCRLNGWISKAI